MCCACAVHVQRWGTSDGVFAHQVLSDHPLSVCGLAATIMPSSTDCGHQNKPYVVPDQGMCETRKCNIKIYHPDLPAIYYIHVIWTFVNIELFYRDTSKINQTSAGGKWRDGAFGVQLRVAMATTPSSWAGRRHHCQHFIFAGGDVGIDWIDRI